MPLGIALEGSGGCTVILEAWSNHPDWSIEINLGTLACAGAGWMDGNPPFPIAQNHPERGS